MELQVKFGEAVMVRPCLPSPKSTLYLSNFDAQSMLRFFVRNILVYRNSQFNSLGDPANVIREALSRVLVYYYPLAGRVRNSDNGKLEVECSAEGVPFITATSHNTLSVLGDCDDLKPSFNQLLSTTPLDTEIGGIHPLVLQVTRFSCGGFVLGYRFYHSVVDGLGVGQFLKGLGEMARGVVKLSVQPVWDRELLKPRNPPYTTFHHFELVTKGTTSPFPEHEEFVPYCFVLGSKRLRQIRECLMEECKEHFSSFDIGAALVWRAMTKAYEVPHSHNVMLSFAMNARKLLKPPLQNGYYGNCFYPVYALAKARELLDVSILQTVMIINKSKLLPSDEYLRSSIDFLKINRQVINAHMQMPMKNVVIMSDWRWLDFTRVDFGWGEPTIVSPIEWRGLLHANYVAFLPPPKCKDGIKVLVCMPKTTLKLFEKEMKAGVLANSMKKDSLHSLL